ncbi:MAG: phage tail protein [Fusobacteriaceae bacterium]
MIIGTLGKIVFSVSRFYIKTITDVSMDSSVNWSEHKIIGNKPKLQFLGAELDTVSFKIVLSAFQNVNPLKSADELSCYMKNGTVLNFILGGMKVGKGRYVITSLKESHKKFNSLGIVTVMEIDISLKEYN